VGKILHFSLVVLLVVVLNDYNKQIAGAAARQGAAAIPRATQPPRVHRILTKDAEYLRLLHPPTDDAFLHTYSSAYRHKETQIEFLISQMEDAYLRDQAREDEWSKVDKAKFKEEADSVFNAARRKYISAHRSAWFEVGDCEYKKESKMLHIYHGDEGVAIDGYHKVVPAMDAEFDVKVDLIAMDAAYRKLRPVAQGRINAHINKDVDDIIRISHPHFSREQLRQSIRESQGNEYFEREVVFNMVLVGQGDIEIGRVDRLFLVDYDTETILLELDPHPLIGHSVWVLASDPSPTVSVGTPAAPSLVN